jgi:hypothetical protein
MLRDCHTSDHGLVAASRAVASMQRSEQFGDVLGVATGQYPDSTARTLEFRQENNQLLAPPGAAS